MDIDVTILANESIKISDKILIKLIAPEAWTRFNLNQTLNCEYFKHEPKCEYM
jgi:hypothetical protein